uniref:Uncharacterized protein n=1 Tax=Palpitomonas bilix TaxID=652834 RepID=A0A7S3G7I2_9EUKA|mmetsp:Transcript_25861/g.65460  ORF Transcript_25861/g.65460 Transcript_25861/m.65460 type:complete len:583 (+) Transcript_25861:273-2021(+)
MMAGTGVVKTLPPVLFVLFATLTVAVAATRGGGGGSSVEDVVAEKGSAVENTVGRGSEQSRGGTSRLNTPLPPEEPPQPILVCTLNGNLAYAGIVVTLPTYINTTTLDDALVVPSTSFYVIYSGPLPPGARKMDVELPIIIGGDGNGTESEGGDVEVFMTGVNMSVPSCFNMYNTTCSHLTLSESTSLAYFYGANMTLTVPSQKRGYVDHIHYTCSPFSATLVNSSAYYDFASVCFNPWDSSLYVTVVYFALNIVLLLPTVILLVRFYWRGGRAPSPQKVTFWVIFLSCLLNTVFPVFQYYGYFRSELSAFSIETVGIGLHICILLFLGFLMHDALPANYTRGATKGKAVSIAAQHKKKWFGGVFKRTQVELGALISVTILAVSIITIVGFGSTVFNCYQTSLQGPLVEGVYLSLDGVYLFLALYFAWRGGKVLVVLKEISQILPDDVRATRLRQGRRIRMSIIWVLFIRAARFGISISYFLLNNAYVEYDSIVVFQLFEVPIGMPLQVAIGVMETLEIMVVIILLGRTRGEGRKVEKYKARASVRLSANSTSEGRHRLISSEGGWDESVDVPASKKTESRR